MVYSAMIKGQINKFLKIISKCQKWMEIFPYAELISERILHTTDHSERVPNKGLLIENVPTPKPRVKKIASFV